MIEAAWLAKLPASVRAAGRSILRGFEEHGWSGKLFMLMTAGTTLVPLLGGLAFVLSDLGGRNSGFYGAFIFVFMLPFVLFQLRVLLGIARFESWARWLAMLGCTFGILTGLGSLAVTRGPQFWVTSAAEVALSTQFLVYFVRNGDRFGRRRLRESAPEVDRLGR
jgi:hypothetical protein